MMYNAECIFIAGIFPSCSKQVGVTDDFDYVEIPSAVPLCTAVDTDTWK